MSETIRLDPSDNVVTATKTLEAGLAVETVTTQAIIPRNHKLATCDIAAGEPVRKYAQIIGYAGEDIAAGAHVHVHNVSFRNTDADYGPRPTSGRRSRSTRRRATSSWGSGARTGGSGRNYIGILTSVNCSATARG